VHGDDLGANPLLKPFRPLFDASATAILIQPGFAGSITLEAVETLLELMRSASSESARLGAARALLDFVGRRRSDPITEAINGLTTVSGRDLARIMNSVVVAALERLPEAEQEPFLGDVLALASKV
jgi:hypothetical protein